MTPSGPLLPAVDRAAFATALATRLREHGVPVGLTATRDFVDALAATSPRTRTSLYWTARVTLVRDHPDLARFDDVFDAVFGQSVLALDPNARRSGHSAGADGQDSAGADSSGGDPVGGSGLPWVTLPPAVDGAEHRADRALTMPERLPSELAAAVDTPFGELDAGRPSCSAACWRHGCGSGPYAAPGATPCGRAATGWRSGRPWPGPGGPVGNRYGWSRPVRWTGRAGSSCCAT
jgi:hypothetical protein